MVQTPIKPASRTLDIRYAVRDIVVLAQEVAKSGKDMLYLNIGDPNIYDFPNTRLYRRRILSGHEAKSLWLCAFLWHPCSPAGHRKGRRKQGHYWHPRYLCHHGR